MHYDPLSADPSRAASSRFVKVRHPPIFGTKLSPLEWSDSRKRPRPADDHHHPQTQNNHHPQPQPQPQPHKPQQPQQQPPHPPRVETREVVRIVEKPVPIEPVTVLGCAPLVDDRVRHVVNFMLQHVTDRHVEVEAKLGRLIERTENVRAVEVVPVMCETPINGASNGDVRFESNVGEDLFYRINEELNKRVEATQAAADNVAVRYSRTKEVDTFYPGGVRETSRPVRGAGAGAGADVQYERVRVQCKTRLGDMNVLCPGRLCDVRYSASSEVDCELDDGARPEMRRVKDRISYKYDCLSIDITCVDMQGSRDPNAGKTHEVEVEIDSSLYDEVEKYRNQDETSKLFDIASNLVNTVRILLEQ